MGKTMTTLNTKVASVMPPWRDPIGISVTFTEPGIHGAVDLKLYSGGFLNESAYVFQTITVQFDLVLSAQILTDS
jgi:hypothetical protein